MVRGQFPIRTAVRYLLSTNNGDSSQFLDDRGVSSGVHTGNQILVSPSRHVAMLPTA